MTLVLISPPMIKASEPLLGIATLKAFVEARGLRCECIDANAEGQAWLMNPERLDARVAAAEQWLRRGDDEGVQRRIRSWKSLRPKVTRYREGLRNPETYRVPNRYRTLVTSLNKVVGIAGLVHDLERGTPIRASLTDYEDARCCDMDSSSVVEAAGRPEENLFYEYFRSEVLPRLRALSPTIVGLSFIFRSQLLCGAVLARMIKAALPETHVVLGGELISAWVPFIERTELMALADSVIAYEGELGLLALAQAIEANPEAPALEGVPNLVWRDAGGRIHRNATRKVRRLDEIPAPDYSWVPWSQYLVPERTAPMVTARGCYWNRCTFCPEVVNPETRLRLAPVDQLTRDMDEVHERWGVTCFHFIDSALPPRTLSGVARHVEEGQRPYRWYGFSRLEKTLLKEDMAAQLGRGGCRMLKLGLETGSQRLLDVMDKGQDIDVVSAILRALHGAGVMVHAFLMFGTPHEHREDAEATHRFVAAHDRCIQFMNCSLMNLAHGSPMALDPPAHGITGVTPFEIEGRSLDLALYSNFECEGWGRLEARRYLHRSFLKDPQVRPLHLRTPAHFDSNHSVFFHEHFFPEGAPG